MKTNHTVSELLEMFAYNVKHCDRYSAVWCLEAIEDQTEGDIDQHLPAIRQALAHTGWRFALIAGASRIAFANYFELVDGVTDSKLDLEQAIKSRDEAEIARHEENLRTRYADLLLMATPADWKGYSPKQTAWELFEVFDDVKGYNEWKRGTTTRDDLIARLAVLKQTIDAKRDELNTKMTSDFEWVERNTEQTHYVSTNILEIYVSRLQELSEYLIEKAIDDGDDIAA